MGGGVKGRGGECEAGAGPSGTQWARSGSPLARGCRRPPPRKLLAKVAARNSRGGPRSPADNGHHVVKR